MLTLTIPQRNDPVSRIVLLVLLGAAVVLNVVSFGPPAQAQSDEPGIVFIEPTPALPTAEPALMIVAPNVDQPAPALELAAPTPELQWAAEPDQASVDNSDYLANVGAQADHAPRGDVEHLPIAQGGPILYPGNYIIAPVGYDDAPDAAAPPAIAVAVPQISAEQAAVLAERDSNGCAAGQVFYPRTGCHTPGSGGEMPGAVGAP